MISELIEVFSLHFKNETFKVLLEDGFLMPTSEQLAAIGIIAEGKDFKPYFKDKTSLLSFIEYVEQEAINIPQVVAKIWSPFFNFCNENSLIGFIFDQLIEANSQENIENALRSKFLISWILYFLKMNSNKSKAILFNSKCFVNNFFLIIIFNRN